MMEYNSIIKDNEQVSVDDRKDSDTDWQKRSLVIVL